MRSPTYRNGRWSLLVGPNEASSLEGIPGLYLNGCYVNGSIDAVAAACRLVGAELPAKPTRNFLLPVERIDLRVYQREGVIALAADLRTFGGALLADDMGLGKTRQAIALFSLMKANPVLVVCPAAVRETWRKELLAWGVPASSICVYGPSSDRHYQDDRVRLPTATWVVTSYELLEDVANARFTNQAPSALVIDEVHMVKGRKTQRSKLLEDVAASATYRLGISGTPFDNVPRDLWQVLRIILAGKRFGTKSDFDFRYCDGAINDHGGMDNAGATNTEELALRLSYYMVRREKKGVLSEMPRLTRQVLWVDADAGGSRAWQVALTRRHPGDYTKALIAAGDAKVQAAVDLCVEARRFLCFTWTKHHAEQIGRMVKKAGVDCFVIHGDMQQAQRQKLITQAAHDHLGIVATLDSLGTGVDGLQHVASFGVMHTLDPRPKKMAQGEKRLDRLGQTEPVQWTYLCCRDSADELVHRSVIAKLGMGRDVLGSTDDEGMAEELNVGAEREMDAEEMSLLAKQLAEVEEGEED